MTVALLELLLGALLVYCAIVCVALFPALLGRQQPGTHCTGSLIAVGIAALGAIFSAILGGAGLAELLALLGIGAAAGRASKKGKKQPTPTPPKLSPIPRPPTFVPPRLQPGVPVA